MYLCWVPRVYGQCLPSVILSALTGQYKQGRSRYISELFERTNGNAVYAMATQAGIYLLVTSRNQPRRARSHLYRSRVRSIRVISRDQLPLSGISHGPRMLRASFMGLEIRGIWDTGMLPLGIKGSGARGQGCWGHL